MIQRTGGCRRRLRTSGPGWRKLRPGAGSADLTLFCPDLALSLSPPPRRPSTAVPHSRQEGNSGTGCLSSPLAFSTPLLPPFPPVSTFVVLAWDALSHPRTLSVGSIRTHVRRHAFSGVTLSPLFLVPVPHPFRPSASLLKVYKAVTPSSHQRERGSNRLRYRDLEWNRGSVTVTIYSYRIRIALG